MSKMTVKEWKQCMRDDLQSIIDFVGGADSEVEEYVKEIKKTYR